MLRSMPVTTAEAPSPSFNPLAAVSPFRLIAVAVFALAISLVSNTLEPAVLGHKVLRLAPDNPNTALGLTTAAGLVIAALTQPIIGALSDRTRNSLGRRVPFFIIGVVLVIACLYLIAAAPLWSIVIIGVLANQFAINVVHGPWQALFTDLVPSQQRGQVAGLRAMFDILAVVIGGFLAGQLVGRYNQWGFAAILAAVTVPTLALLIALVITFFGAREPADAINRYPPTTSIGQALSNAYRINWSAHPAFFWWFLNRLFFWTALLGLNTYLLFYVIQGLGLEEGFAQRLRGNVTLVLGVSVLVFSLPVGWLSDCIGRKPIVALAGVLASVGMGLVILPALLPEPNLTLLFVAAGFIGLALGMFLSTSWALVTDIVPEGEAARYLGIANIATAGGSLFGRLAGGLLIDPINNATGNPIVGFLAMFGLSLALFLLSAITISFLPTRQPAAN